MSVQSLDVLPADSGQDLPKPVRDALVDFGTAANTIALALNQASLTEAQALATEDSARAQSQPDSQVANLSSQLAECALSFLDQLTVVYAGVAARYAAYASRVAVDIAAGREPTTPTPQDLALLPSQLIDTLDRLLPPVELTATHVAANLVEDQNREVNAAREVLTSLVAQQLYDSPAEQYDDPAAVARRPATSFDLVIGFPAALHAYAATLTWAVGVVTGPAD